MTKIILCFSHVFTITWKIQQRKWKSNLQPCGLKDDILSLRHPSRVSKN